MWENHEWNKIIKIPVMQQIVDEEWVEGPPTIDKEGLGRSNFCVTQVNDIAIHKCHKVIQYDFFLGE